jgi:integrase
MPRPRNPFPKPRLHKGAAVVELYEGGTRRTVTLGPWGSEQAQEEYERLLARLRAAPPTRRPAAKSADLTLNELMLAYLRWTDQTRHAGVRPSRSGTSPRFALRRVREMFGTLPVAEFGPKALKAVRDAWVVAGLSRKVINGRVGAVRRMFRWAVAEELAGPEVYQRLQAVEGLRAGQTPAADRSPVRPAVWADVEKVLPLLPEPIRVLVYVQVFSGARAGELVRLRVGDIDRTNPDAWVYRPATHKGTWKGKGRVIYFGRRCQEVLAPLLLKAGGPDESVFSPARSETERLAARAAERVTPRYPSHVRRNERKRVGKGRRTPPGEKYTTGTYRQAVERACERAGVPAFTPHRLRHLAATRTREELGVDVARALLGHSVAAVTEIYSHEVDNQLAMKAVEKFG